MGATFDPLLGQLRTTDTDLFVLKSGDTMTGPLTIGTNNGGTSPSLYIGETDNASVYESYNGRAFVGYNASGFLHLQGSTSKGIYFTVNNATFGATPAMRLDTTGLLLLSTDGLTASSGNQAVFTINSVVNQTSTASYTMLAINPSVGTTGSGTNYLIDAQVSSSPRFQLSANVGATNQMLVTAPNGSGDVALGIQNNAVTANETASLNFYTTTNLANPFGRVRLTRVDGTSSRLALGPMTSSAIVNHIQMYGDTGLMSIGAGSTPANGLVTIGTGTTTAAGGLYFGTDVNLYRSAANTLKTDDALYVTGSITTDSFVQAINRYYLYNSGSNFPGLEAYASTDSGFVYHYFYRSRAGATQSLANDVLGAFGFRGHTGSAYMTQDSVRLSASASENTGATYGGHLDVNQVTTGTSTSVLTWRFASGGVLQSRVTGTSGGLSFGSGGTQDTNLYRSAADTLKTDDSFVIGGSLTIADAQNVILNTTTGTKIGTATSQKLGFWNATPIVQPTTAVAAATFVTNTSLIANDTATFDGYTIGQVVKALRNAGILA